MQSKLLLVAERRQEMHFLNNEEKEKYIEDYVERETSVARMRVEDTVTSIKPE